MDMYSSILGIIQARMGSTRLPGKIFKKIESKTSLAVQLDRLKQCRFISKFMIATSENPQDKIIYEFSKSQGLYSYRGSEDDVLDRFYQAAIEKNAKHICRLTADCPFIDPHVVDQIAHYYLENIDQIDYVASGRTFPHGTASVEFFSFKTLEKAWKESTNQQDREHVTRFIRKRPNRFRIKIIEYKKDLSKYRITLDYFEDLNLIRAVARGLGVKPNVGIEEIVNFLDANPNVKHLTENIMEKDTMIREFPIDSNSV